MQTIGFNHGWEFTLQNKLDAFNHFGLVKFSDASGAPAASYPYSNWEQVDLPHDWAVALPKTLEADTGHGARSNTAYHGKTPEQHSNLSDIYDIGWYRKSFSLDEADAGKRVFLEFDGVFRDSIVWVNGAYIDRHNSGYTGFIYEITDFVHWDRENSVVVRVDASQPEGWWYEGAGIYRNVFLHITQQVCLKPDTTYVRARADGSAHIETVLDNRGKQDACGKLICRILDQSGTEQARTEADIQVGALSEQKASFDLNITNPLLWSPEMPNLYTLELCFDDETHHVRFGYRDVAFDPDKGFMLNGKPCKVHGACCHQDFGGVGVAVPDNLIQYKILRLKDMGVNAYRSSHHPASQALLNACDELGMLVMDETRSFSTSPEGMRQLTALITRSRNHPSVFIWSVGNEEFSVQDTPWSATIAEKMCEIIRTMDDRPITYAGNNGGLYVGANSVVPVRGVNYIRNGDTGYWLDEYHAAHPKQPIIGTEETSYLLSRGGGKTDMARGVLDSSGLVTTPWASTPKGWVAFFEKRDWLAGSFMWTGFDYRGEPMPFNQTNVSSSFGTIDLTGIEKPPYWYYRAWWMNVPTLKLTPHWNFTPGETVTVHVFTNCTHISLFINGRQVAEQDVQRFDAPIFTVPFEAGTVTVKGILNGQKMEDTLQTAGAPVSYPIQSVLDPKSGDDVGILEISARDANGIFCPTADNLLRITALDGEIIGVGNGDPADLMPEQMQPEIEYLPISTFTCGDQYYKVPAKAENKLVGASAGVVRESPVPEGFEDDVRYVISRPRPAADAAEQNYTFSLNHVGQMEFVEFERFGAPAVVYLNGVEIGSNKAEGRMSRQAVNRPYRFPCHFTDGENELRVALTASSGELPPISGYVRLGRFVKPTWKVKLHYGKARVFVKKTGNASPRITAESCGY